MKSRKLNILIATGIYPPEIGGPATYSKLLEDELPRYGHSVSVLPFREVRSLPKIIRHIAYFFKTISIARKNNIILALDPVSVGLPAMCVSKILHKPFVLRVPGDYAWEQYQKDINKFISPEDFQDTKFDFITELRRKIQRLVARNATTIITPSEYLKKIVMRWGIESDKIQVIHSTFNIPANMQTKNELRAELNINNNVIVSAGRLVSWKGFELLIEIMQDILVVYPKTVLYIIGDGPDKKLLSGQIKDVDLEENVILLGQLSKDELARYIKLSDIFVLNTGYEGLSHVLLEAMSLGAPVVTTSIGGNPELIENNKDGLLVEYNNKRELQETILKVLSKDIDNIQIAKNALAKVTQFGKEKMIEQTVSLLNSVVK